MQGYGVGGDAMDGDARGGGEVEAEELDEGGDGNFEEKRGAVEHPGPGRLV